MSDTPDTPNDVVSIFDLVETDTSAEENGRWFKNVFGAESGVDLKMRAYGSRESQKVRRRLERGYKGHIRNGELPDDISEKFLIEHLAEAVLLDWRGVFDKDKQPILYSKAAAVTLLTRITAFRQVVLIGSQQIDGFRFEEREEGVKN